VPGADAAEVLVANAVAPVTAVAGLLAAILAGLLLVRWWLGRGAKAPVHVTWGCGYTAPSPRMQYSGASFSAQFVEVFDAVLTTLRRAKLPVGFFPAKGKHLSTTCVDSVEQRMFESLGRSELLARRIAALVSGEPTVSFAAGLLVLCALVLFAIGGSVFP
jgi:hydrogenase-4 component B